MRPGPGPGAALGRGGRTLTRGARDFVPALGHRGLTPLYDPVQRIFLREGRWKGALARSADLRPGQRVLDVGCGTGTLAIRLAERGPGVDVRGIDRDPAMLDRARRKAARRDAGIGWQRARSTALPFPDRRFDRVFSSLLLHHLPPTEKRRTVEEMRRVLRPGGLLLLADWNRIAHLLERAAYFLAVQLLDGLETTAGHVDDLLPRLLRDGGLEEVRREGRFTTPAGPLEIWRGRRPGPPADGAPSPP